MQIKKLETVQELVAVDKLLSTAFLHKWNEEDARKKAESGEKEPGELTWGLVTETGKILSGIRTSAHRMVFDGHIVPSGELNMVGSLPEARGGGNIRTLVREVLTEMKSRGDVFATLHPFSYRFYRKFGFELMGSGLQQKFPIGELAGFDCSYQVTQVESEQDIPILRELCDSFVLQHNLEVVREDKDWVYRGNGEFGQPNFWMGDKQSYTYLFRDLQGQAHAYLTFCFEPDPQMFMVGTMEVTSLVYDSPAAFRQVLGFIYFMRAKVRTVSIDCVGVPDLSTLIPECGEVKRSMDCHSMLRVLDPARILTLLRHPAGKGRYTVSVADNFLPENTATYAVSFDNGAAEVAVTKQRPDLELTIETFGQLATGLIDLNGSLYREGTRLNGNEAMLRRVFVRKM